MYWTEEEWELAIQCICERIVNYREWQSNPPDGDQGYVRRMESAILQEKREYELALQLREAARARGDILSPIRCIRPA